MNATLANLAKCHNANDINLDLGWTYYIGKEPNGKTYYALVFGDKAFWKDYFTTKKSVGNEKFTMQCLKPIVENPIYKYIKEKIDNGFEEWRTRSGSKAKYMMMRSYSYVGLKNDIEHRKMNLSLDSIDAIDAIV